jgi:HEPN domain-containing protein
MVKSDKDHALQMLAMAKKDHQALAHMLDARNFSEEIFGFHAQQAIEKGLKAWIAGRGLTYPKSHDVSALIKILEDHREDLSKFPNLEDYTIFAVQYRYEAYDESEDELDRQEIIAGTSLFLAHVEAILDAIP